jgi:hypothetical protein
LEQIKEIIENKYKNVEIYKLNPNINDLLNNNLYKLYVDDVLYLVPLWQRENYFDSSDISNNEIIVICEPELPDNIKIDDKNNIHVEYKIPFSQLNKIIEDNFIDVPIGNSFYKITVSNLNMIKEQNFIFKKKGLLKDNVDFNDISNKTDIIVKIILT